MKKLLLAIVIAGFLSGCAHELRVAPSVGPLPQLTRSGEARALITVVKGDQFFPSQEKSGYTDLSSRQASAFLTKDDIVAALRESTVTAFESAGYTVDRSLTAQAGYVLDQALGDADVRMKIFVELLRVSKSGMGDFDQSTVQLLEHGDFGANEACKGQKYVAALLTRVAITDETSHVIVGPVSGVGCRTQGATEPAALESAIRQSIDAFRVNVVHAVRKFKERKGNP